MTHARVTYDYPAVGRLTGSWCTATLIHRQAVLTSAHCFDEVEGDPGGFLIETEHGELFVPLERVEPSPGYRSTGGPRGFHDIAVGVLAHPIELTPQPLRWSRLRAGDHVRLVGYGRPAVDEPPDGAKRTAVVDVERAVATEVVLEAEAGESHACPGDSGSPYLDPVTHDVLAVHRAGTCRSGGGRNLGIPILLHRGFIEQALSRVREPELRSHPLLFDPELYAALHPELHADAIDAHWRDVGWPSGARGSETFDPVYYRRAHDLGDLSPEALARHWLDEGLPMGLPGSEEVDPVWLESAIADFNGWPLGEHAHTTALHHHVAEGLYYPSSSTFDVTYYMTAYEDWREPGDVVSYRLAVAHYLRVGKPAGRRAIGPR